tara:strand:- start:398 stop:538 length:141 start_codon:yes stop_codon:yes gene_type:complete
MEEMAKKYLDMWLSEQIPLKEWLKLLDENPAIEKAYKDHIRNINNN